ncbi:hypothetical protein EJ08DRAFT_255900 [Tothia fuscella]|uniref:Uncharacterized protein n=1 Tax=Tothia fuscella TaxID=1048955 RepID=A0A9P4NR47_9PEZI|nr:hypothetical protein EJ08DRAFT_255900 [Tothia fuscella]
MPTYRPLQTTVQLYVCPLDETTTTQPERRKAAFSTNEADKAERNIKRGRLLKETPIPYCNENSRLHFLGLNQEVPFFLIHAGEDLFRKNQEESVAEHAQAVLKDVEAGTSHSGARRDSQQIDLDIAFGAELQSSPLSSVDSVNHADSLSEITEGPRMLIPFHPASGVEKAATIHPVADSRQSSATYPKLTTAARADYSSKEGFDAPQAIALYLNTSEKAFLPAFGETSTAQDVKVDVFYNGELTECMTIPSRWKSNTTVKPAGAVTNPVISGRRVDRLVERPWVVVPIIQNADGSLRSTRHTKASKAGAKGRWEEISKAILHEAEMQGFNKYGDCTPTGSYLASLAALPMPEAVEKLQKGGGPKFGVIDIVISVGTGKKGRPDTYYLKQPTRLANERFRPRPGGFLREGSEIPASTTAFTKLSRDPPSSADLNAKANLEAQNAVNRSCNQIAGQIDTTELERIQRFNNSEEDDPEKAVMDNDGLTSCSPTYCTSVEMAKSSATSQSAGLASTEDVVIEEVDLISCEATNDVVVEQEIVKADEEATVHAMYSDRLFDTIPEEVPAVSRQDLSLANGVLAASVVHGRSATPRPRRASAAFSGSYDETSRRNSVSSNKTFSTTVSDSVHGFPTLDDVFLPPSAFAFFDSSTASTSFGYTPMTPLTSFPSFEPTYGDKLNGSPAWASSFLAEEYKRDRASTMQTEVSDIVMSSPEDGRHQRGYLRMPGYEDSILKEHTSSAPQSGASRIRGQTLMGPPQTPLSVPASTKRRHSDAILLNRSDFLFKRRRSSLLKDISSNSSTTSELGVSRRGVFKQSPLKKELRLLGADDLSSGRSTPQPREGSGRVNRSKTASMIRHIVIECRGIVIVNKTLNPPLPLQRIDRGISLPPPSPVFPLHESLVFGLKDMTKPAAPTPSLPPPKPKPAPIQQRTPLPSSSPTRPPQSSPTRKPRGRRPTIMSSLNQKRRGPPPPYVEELREQWTTPDLSKDSVLAYAEDGVWLDEKGGGVFRHVKSARPGWFVESEVLFGVRYLVG